MYYDFISLQLLSNDMGTIRWKSTFKFLLRIFFENCKLDCSASNGFVNLRRCPVTSRSICNVCLQSTYKACPHTFGSPSKACTFTFRSTPTPYALDNSALSIWCNLFNINVFHNWCRILAEIESSLVTTYPDTGESKNQVNEVWPILLGHYSRLMLIYICKWNVYSNWYNIQYFKTDKLWINRIRRTQRFRLSA
jgi:hypothetical protein